MTISKKIHKFIEQGGWIRKMFESGIILKQQYGSDNVFDLSLGVGLDLLKRMFVLIFFITKSPLPQLEYLQHLASLCFL